MLAPIETIWQLPLILGGDFYGYMDLLYFIPLFT